MFSLIDVQASNRLSSEPNVKKYREIVRNTIVFAAMMNASEPPWTI